MATNFLRRNWQIDSRFGSPLELGGQRNFIPPANLCWTPHSGGPLKRPPFIVGGSCCLSANQVCFGNRRSPCPEATIHPHSSFCSLCIAAFGSFRRGQRPGVTSLFPPRQGVRLVASLGSFRRGQRAGVTLLFPPRQGVRLVASLRSFKRGSRPGDALLFPPRQGAACPLPFLSLN